MARAWFVPIAVAALVPGTVAARSVRTPVVGNWEGTGPHGLALSFQLARRGSRLRATALAVTVPVGCPPTVRQTVTLAGTNPVYAGPRAAPPGLSRPLLSKPGTIGLTFTAARYVVDLEGPLLNRRRALLRMSAPAGANVACWPRTLRFTTRPATRTAVADGAWTGSLASTNGVTGAIRLVVAGRGRAVTSFSFALHCPDTSGAPAYSYGPDVNGQFIRADGTFTGPVASSAAIAWKGRFGGEKVSGSLANLGDPCGLGTSQAATFTAAHVS
jgi:hypothetical protein